MATLIRKASLRRNTARKRRCRRVVSFTKEVFVLDAIREGNIYQVEELFSSDGEDEPLGLNAQLVGGKTPLHLAINALREDVVKFLLERGAQPDIADDSGFTPLHRAVESGEVILARLLIEFGANPRRRTPENCLPLDLAMEQCDSEMMEVIAMGCTKANESGSSVSWTDSALADEECEAIELNGTDYDARSTFSSGSRLFAPSYREGDNHDRSCFGNGECSSLDESSVCSFENSVFPSGVDEFSPALFLPFSPETDHELQPESALTSPFQFRAGRAHTPVPLPFERPLTSASTDTDIHGRTGDDSRFNDDSFVFQVPDAIRLPPPPKTGSLKRNTQLRSRGSFRRSVSSLLQTAANAMSTVSLSSTSESDSQAVNPLSRSNSARQVKERKPEIARENQTSDSNSDLSRSRFSSFRRRKRPKSMVILHDTTTKHAKTRQAPVISDPMDLQHLSSGIVGLHLQAGYSTVLPVTAL